MTEREMVLLESVVRKLLVDIINRRKDTCKDVRVILHNVSYGAFDDIERDVDPDEIDIVCSTLYDDMMGVVSELKDKFDLNLDVPMEVELKIGDDWLDMDEISVDNQTNLNITEDNNNIGELHDRECTNNQRHRQLTH